MGDFPCKERRHELAKACLFVVQARADILYYLIQVNSERLTLLTHRVALTRQILFLLVRGNPHVPDDLAARRNRLGESPVIAERSMMFSNKTDFLPPANRLRVELRNVGQAGLLIGI